MRRGEGNAFMNVSYPHGFLHQPMGGPVLDLAKLFEPSTGLGVELDAHSGCIHCCPEVALEYRRGIGSQLKGLLDATASTP